MVSVEIPFIKINLVIYFNGDKFFSCITIKRNRNNFPGDHSTDYFLFLLIIPKKNWHNFYLIVCSYRDLVNFKNDYLKDLNQNTGVINSVLNNTLNAAPDFISKYATIFYILLRYVVLLIFPHPLTCDYNFNQIKIQTLQDPASLIGIVFYLGLGIYSIINFRKKSIIAFGILFFLITLAPVSNIFFLGGSTMAERFMYIPSLGFCICLTYFLIKLTKTESIKSRFKNLSKFFSFNSALFFLYLGIIVLYSFKTFSRNKDWKDNITIFGHDVQISENSVTAHFIQGSSLLND